MPGIRPTTSPSLPLERFDRSRPLSRAVVQPVHLDPEVEADRRRSLQEDLDAAEEHLPLAAIAGSDIDVHELAADLRRLGSDALRLLQPVVPEIETLGESGHVDEQA